MNDFWLILITGLLIYLLYDRERDKKKAIEKDRHMDESLMDFVGEYCEIELKEWLVSIDESYEIKGFIKEMDDDWLLIEIVKKEKIKTIVIKKSIINSIKIVKQKV